MLDALPFLEQKKRTVSLIAFTPGSTSNSHGIVRFLLTEASDLHIVIARFLIKRNYYDIDIISISNTGITLCSSSLPEAS